MRVTVDELRTASRVVQTLSKVERRALLRRAIEAIGEVGHNTGTRPSRAHLLRVDDIQLVASSSATAADSLVQQALIAAAEILEELME
jgi:hypothetical protein